MATTGIAVAPSLLVSCKDKESDGTKPTDKSTPSATSANGFTLPELGYSYDALNGVIDSQTMEIHHSKHHQGYTNKLNAALAEQNISNTSIEDILKSNNLSTAIRNNGGGYYNHCLYWEILKPGGTMPKDFEKTITDKFGSKDAMLNELKTAGLKQFGSGWSWLCQDADKQLFISATPNQDNPLMQVAEKKGHPILGVDVWEHAYYLKYQNKRGDYLTNVLNNINWEVVASKMV